MGTASEQPGLVMRTALRLVALAVALTAATVCFGVEPAGAWTDGACADASGVTVVVDFHQLGGGVVVRCATGPVSSGFDALARAGFEQREALRSSGFLCRIDDKPADDPCVDASPANAYWSYWHADRGGSWIYGDLGGANRTPPAGSVEGWSFAQNASGSNLPRPGIDPPPLAVTTTVAPTTAVRPTTTTAQVRRTTTTLAATGSPSTTTTAAPAVAVSASTSTSIASTTSTTAARAETASAPRVRVTSDDDSGTPVGTIVGVGGVVVLGAGAAIGAKRRRSADA